MEGFVLICLSYDYDYYYHYYYYQYDDDDDYYYDYYYCLSVFDGFDSRFLMNVLVGDVYKWR